MGVKLAHDLRHRGDRGASSPTTSARSRRRSRRRCSGSRAPTRSSSSPRGSCSASATRTASARSSSAGSRTTSIIASETLRARPARRRVRARGRTTASWSSCDENGLRGFQAVPEDEGGGALCIFEFIYFARPDSKLRGVELHGARVRMGERLAEEAPVAADIVIGDPRLGHAGGDRLRARERHPVQRGPDQEPLRRPDVHPARPGAARARDQDEVQPARRGGRQARRGRGRLDRARHDDPQDRRDALRGGRRGGARARVVAADRLAVLLRDRHGDRGAS